MTVKCVVCRRSKSKAALHAFVMRTVYTVLGMFCEKLLYSTPEIDHHPGAGRGRMLELMGVFDSFSICELRYGYPSPSLR